MSAPPAIDAPLHLLPEDNFRADRADHVREQDQRLLPRQCPQRADQSRRHVPRPGTLCARSARGGARFTASAPLFFASSASRLCAQKKLTRAGGEALWVAAAAHLGRPAQRRRRLRAARRPSPGATGPQSCPSRAPARPVCAGAGPPSPNGLKGRRSAGEVVERGEGSALLQPHR